MRTAIPNRLSEGLQGTRLISVAALGKLRLAVVKTVLRSHFGGEFTTHLVDLRCTTHFRTYLSGWIGMLTGGAIWILTHGQVSLGSSEEKHSWMLGRDSRWSGFLAVRQTRGLACAFCLPWFPFTWTLLALVPPEWCPVHARLS